MQSNNVSSQSIQPFLCLNNREIDYKKHLTDIDILFNKTLEENKLAEKKISDLEQEIIRLKKENASINTIKSNKLQPTTSNLLVTPTQLDTSTLIDSLANYYTDVSEEIQNYSNICRDLTESGIRDENEATFRMGRGGEAHLIIMKKRSKKLVDKMEKIHNEIFPKIHENDSKKKVFEDLMDKIKVMNERVAKRKFKIEYGWFCEGDFTIICAKRFFHAFNQFCSSEYFEFSCKEAPGHFSIKNDDELKKAEQDGIKRIFSKDTPQNLKTATKKYDTNRIVFNFKTLENRDIENWNDEFYAPLHKCCSNYNKLLAIGILFKSGNHSSYQIRPSITRITDVEILSPKINEIFTFYGDYNYMYFDPKIMAQIKDTVMQHQEEKLNKQYSQH